MEAFITVAVFDYIHQIEILKHRLDIEEIQYYFENELISSIVSMYSTACGGIKLKIHSNDIAIVQNILLEFKYDNKLNIV